MYGLCNLQNGVGSGRRVLAWIAVLTCGWAASQVFAQAPGSVAAAFYSGAGSTGPTPGTVVLAGGAVADGSLDLSFDPGLGPNETVRAIGLQTNGMVVIGGSFTNVSESPRKHVARLLSSGALDTNYLAPIFVTNTVGWVTNYVVDHWGYVTVVVTNDLSLVTNEVAQGANAAVSSIAIADSGKILIGGGFTEVNRTNRKHVARMQLDGAIDPVFNQSNDLNAAILAVASLPGGKVLAGGGFTRPKAGIVRFLNNATADSSFDPEAGVQGAIHTVALQANGRVVICGDFSSVNQISRTRVARLLDYGPLDLSFVPPNIPTGMVFAAAIQKNGKILIAGNFTTIGTNSCGGIARLNEDGSLDPTFNPGLGADGAIYALLIQPDGRIVVGGDFLHFNGMERMRLTRLNADGALDSSFHILEEVDGAVFALAWQPDGRILVGGSFTRMDGVVRQRVARLMSTAAPTKDIVIQSNVTLVGGQLTVYASTESGFSYALEASTNFVNWIDLSTTTASGPLTEFTDPNASAYPRRFYRIRWPAP